MWEDGECEVFEHFVVLIFFGFSVLANIAWRGVAIRWQQCSLKLWVDRCPISTHRLEHARLASGLLKKNGLNSVWVPVVQLFPLTSLHYFAAQQPDEQFDWPTAFGIVARAVSGRSGCWLHRCTNYSCFGIDRRLLWPLT